MNLRERGISEEVSERKPSPERLTDEQLANLLSAIGNHEAKANLIRLMRTNIPYTDTGLKQIFMESQGPYKGWDIAGKTLYSYCRVTLAPIGLVAREYTDTTHKVYGYARTEYGERVGVPLAGLLLDFSSNHPDHSLRELFGGTQSPSKLREVETQEEKLEYKKRSPGIRLKIFWELATAELPIRETDLAARIGEREDVVSVHLAQLAKNRLITYLSAGGGQPFSHYSLSEQRPEGIPSPFSTAVNLTQQVYELLQSDSQKVWTINEVVNHFIQIRDGKKNQSLSSRIANILAHLRREGYAEVQDFSHDKQSAINLTEDQQNVFIDLVGLLDDFQKQDTDILERGKMLAQNLSSQDIGVLMQKAKERSSNANQSPVQETEGIFLSIIQGRPGITASEIQQELEESHNKHISVKRVQQIIHGLREQGKLVAGNEKNNIRWTIR